MNREVAAGIFDALDGKIPLLELRGGDKHARSGGDLDFMVPAGRAVEACRLVADAFIAEGWFLLGFRNLGYLAQIIVVLPGAKGDDFALKIDFFDGLRWYGVGDDPAGQALFAMLDSSSENKLKLSGAAGFFQKLLIVGKLSDRDWARIIDTEADSAYLADIAQKLSLPVTRRQAEARGVSGSDKWRVRAASGGANSVFSALVWFLKSSYAHLRFKIGLGQHSGLVIGISGLDGSGKSTLVERLLSAYRVAGVEQPSLVHLLPKWIPLPHQLFRRKKTQSNYTRPYSEPPVSSKLSGSLRLVYYIVAFLSARLYLSVQTLRGRVVVMDRSIVDFGSDPTRSRIPIRRLPNWLSRFLLPKGKHFYLDASPDVVVARKGELSVEKAESLQFTYLQACSETGVTRLDGNGTQDAVFRELLEHLSNEYLRRISDVGAGK